MQIVSGKWTIIPSKGFEWDFIVIKWDSIGFNGIHSHGKWPINLMLVICYRDFNGIHPFGNLTWLWEMEMAQL